VAAKLVKMAARLMAVKNSAILGAALSQSAGRCLMIEFDEE
jgi:hypothetical protein